MALLGGERNTPCHHTNIHIHVPDTCVHTITTTPRCSPHAGRGGQLTGWSGAPALISSHPHTTHAYTPSRQNTTTTSPGCSSHAGRGGHVGGAGGLQVRGGTPHAGLCLGLVPALRVPRCLLVLRLPAGHAAAGGLVLQGRRMGWYRRAGASAVGSSYIPSSQPMHSYPHKPHRPHPSHVQAIKLRCAMLTFWALKPAQMLKFYEPQTPFLHKTPSPAFTPHPPTTTTHTRISPPPFRAGHQVPVCSPTLGSGAGGGARAAGQGRAQPAGCHGAGAAQVCPGRQRLPLLPPFVLGLPGSMRRIHVCLQGQWRSVCVRARVCMCTAHLAPHPCQALHISRIPSETLHNLCMNSRLTPAKHCTSAPSLPNPLHNLPPPIKNTADQEPGASDTSPASPPNTANHEPGASGASPSSALPQRRRS